MNIVSKIQKMIPDEIYLRLQYFYHFKKKLNLNKPLTYNEKLQWLKLYHRNPEYSKYVDKYAVREYVSKTIGKKYLIPLLAVYDSVEEIDWSTLPNKFVIKCTHGSTTNIICHDKDKLNIKEAEEKLTKWMKENWFWYSREWPYKNATPRIIVEEFIEQEDHDELRDYRFFCFHGEPKFVAVDFSINNKKRTRRNLYDMNWELMPAEISYPQEVDMKVTKPLDFDKMIALSRELSKDIPHVRIDFYYINRKIIFGEMTFYHQGGYGKFKPDEFNYHVGNMINLSDLK